MRILSNGEVVFKTTKTTTSLCQSCDQYSAFVQEIGPVDYGTFYHAKQ